MNTHRVVLRRTDGRYVKDFPTTSKYAAKKRKKSWESFYDSTYFCEIIPIDQKIEELHPFEEMQP